MEYSMDAVANRMITIIIGLSILIALAGWTYFHLNSNPLAAIPFAVGVAMAMCVNIIKVFWLKKMVNVSVSLDAGAASLHMKTQYFKRLILTAGVFLVAALAPDNIVNLIGVVCGIFTLTIATYSIQFFFKNQLVDMVVNPASALNASSTQDAVDEINSIVEKAESEAK